MSKCLCFAVVACGVLCCQAQPSTTATRLEAEYYVAAYAQHYGVPIAFVRAIVQQESGWHRCAISHRGAVGLMQLMPQRPHDWECETAATLTRTSPAGCFTSRGLCADSEEICDWLQRVTLQVKTWLPHAVSRTAIPRW
jgi:hypothetical protein